MANFAFVLGHARVHIQMILELGGAQKTFTAKLASVLEVVLVTMNVRSDRIRSFVRRFESAYGTDVALGVAVLVQR